MHFINNFKLFHKKRHIYNPNIIFTTKKSLFPKKTLDNKNIICYNVIAFKEQIYRGVEQLVARWDLSEPLPVADEGEGEIL